MSEERATYNATEGLGSEHVARRVSYMMNAAGRGLDDLSQFESSPLADEYRRLRDEYANAAFAWESENSRLKVALAYIDESFGRGRSSDALEHDNSLEARAVLHVRAALAGRDFDGR